MSIGTVLVNNGTALLTTSSLSLGTHTITAVFSATTNFAASVISNALTQTVTTAGTTTATNANGSSAYGQSTTFTATVAGNNGATGMTGMVTFSDGSTSIGTGTVGGGVATLAAVLIGLGSHTITALYASGDNNFFSSTSAPFTQTVVQAQTSTAVTSFPASVVVDGTSLTFTATVTVNSTSTLSGTVTFLDGVTSLGTGLLNGTSGSSATFMTSALSAGKIHTITAVYNNNDSSDFRGSTASALAQTVLQITSMTAVTTSAPSSTVFGTSVTLTATVSGTSVTLPTGTVTFMDGTTAIGTGVLSNTTPDIATLSISTLSVGGVHTITARYSGDTLSAGSTSATVYRQTVTIATTTTTLTTTAPNPANGGQSLTYTATVTGLGGATGMTGNVTFEANGSPIGSLVPVANGVATLTTTSLTSQTTYTVTAIYNGDNNFSGSTSASLFQTINMTGTTTTVTSSAPAVVLNRSVTLTATVSPTANVTSGTVTFLNGGTALGTAAVGNGTATLATTALPAGTDASITAIYSGNSGFAGSTSAPFSQVVDPATLYWTGSTSLNWNAADWTGPSGETGLTPMNGDSLDFPGGVATGNMATVDNVTGMTFNSLIFQASGYTVGNATNTLSLSGGITSSGNATISTGIALTANQTWSGSSTLTVSGTIAGAYNLTEAGSGTLVLNAANTYSGGTTVSGGVVNVQNASALGTGTVTESGGEVSFQAVSNTSIGLQFNPNGGTAVGTNIAGVVPQQYWTTSTAENGSATALVDSNDNTTTGAVTWTASSDYHSPTGFTAGTGNADLMSSEIKKAITITITSPYPKYDLYIYVNSDNAVDWSISDGTTTYYGAPNDALASFVQVTNTTSGTYPAGNYVKFTGETAAILNITGNMTIGGGESGICGLQIVNAYAASYGNNFAVTGNATLDLSGTTGATIGSLTIGSQTLSVTGNSTGNNTAYTLTTGNVTLTGNPTFNVTNNGNGTGTLSLGALGDGGTARTITCQGNGTVTLGSAATSLINGTAVNVANGTLNFNAAGALGTQANVTVSNGATVNLGANQTFGSLNGTSSTAGVALGTNTLTIGSSNNLSGSFAGAISGTGSVTIAGTGTATLAGANGYTGGTSVTAGTLLVTNSTGSGTGTGTVTVGSGATLGGTGSIGGNVVVNSGGTLSPGTASTPEGTLTLSAGNLTLSSGASLSLNVGNANATSHDQVTVTNGTLSLGTSPTINVTINAGGNIALGNYTLIQASSVSGTATWNTTMTNAPAADTYRVAANGTSVLLNVAVPVATTLLFLQQPTTAPQNATISPAVAVEVLDQFGRLMAVDNNTVALAIGTNPLGNGTLSGNGTMAMVGGIATFSNLSINVIGNGYTLSATDSQDRLSVTSSTFNVTPLPGTFTWTGNGADGSWTNPQNWSISGSPTPTDLYPGQYAGYVVDTVVFNKSGTVTLNGNQSVAGIQFNSGAAITINPTNSTDTLTIGTGGISLAAGANTSG